MISTELLDQSHCSGSPSQYRFAFTVRVGAVLFFSPSLSTLALKTLSSSFPEAGLLKDRNRIVRLLRSSPPCTCLRAWLNKAALNGLILAAALILIAPRLAHAEAHLLIEADTGKVLEAENATIPWYPASLSKIMTAYVTLKAVKDGKITLDTLLTVSPLAASQSPSKMGFKSGTQVTTSPTLNWRIAVSLASERCPAPRSLSMNWDKSKEKHRSF